MKWKLNRAVLKNPYNESDVKLFCGVLDIEGNVICGMDEEIADKYGNIIANSNELYIAVKDAIEVSNSSGRFSKSVIDNLQSIINRIEG